MAQVTTQKEIQTANKQKKFHLTSTISWKNKGLLQMWKYFKIPSTNKNWEACMSCWR